MAGLFERFISGNKKSNTADNAKARLSVLLACNNPDNELVKELQERLKKVIYEFYIEKDLVCDDVENIHYSLDDEAGVMEVSIPIQSN